MKKIMLAAIMMLAVSTLSYAQTNRAGNGSNNTGTRYTDMNKNNLCDHFENGTQPRSGQVKAKKPGNRQGQCKRGNGNRNANRNGY
ncbi:MAG: hypothetical protein WAT19_08915 [Ferruginibacter sp.]